MRVKNLEIRLGHQRRHTLFERLELGARAPDRLFEARPAFERVLTDAGWTGVTIEPLTVTYRFESPVAFWNLTTESGVFKDLLPKFSCHALVAFKARALADVAAYRQGDVIELPNLALIATAEKSS